MQKHKRIIPKTALSLTLAFELLSLGTMLTAFVQAATVEFTAATSSVAEDDAAHTLTVRLNQAGGAALANPVVVNVADAGTGSAGTNTGPCAPTATNVAPSGVASQTSDFQGGVPQNIFPASNALDGNLSNITHTEGRANETDPSWEVDLLAVYSIERIKFYNRSGGWKQRMRDITVTILASDGTTELWNSGLLNPENILNSPDSIEQNIVTLNGSAVGGQIVRIHRTPDPDHSGGTLVGQADSDHGNVLSLGEVEVFGVSASEYTLTTTQVTFPAGSVNGATQTVTVTQASDDDVEGSEDIDLTLSVGSGTATVGNRSTHEVTLTDSDAANVEFAAAASSATEDGGAHSISVRLNITQGVCLARDAVFTIGNAGTGTATGGGTDYTLTTTQVTFAAGSSNGSTQTVTVTPASDALVEGSETANFTATLTSGPATLGTQSIHAFTLDDSDNNILTVTISAASISENGGSSLATVSHTGDTSQALTVTLASNDTSEATVPSSVTIPAGSASQNFTVTGIDEAIVDGAQTVTVTGSAAGFQSGTDTIIVIDNDSPQLSLNITDASISENGGSSAATLIRNTNPGVALVVTLTSSDPSEATIPATITIPVGSNSVGFTVTATDDRYVDGQQTVTITGSAPGLSNGFDTLAVEDDDILNTPPTISPLANQTLFGTSTLGPMEFRVDDDQTAASLLTVRANSNNPTVVLDQNILLGGTGTIRTMIITGINGFGDSANINISATDSSGKTGLSSFSLTAFSESSLVVDNLDAEFSRIGTWQESAAVDEYAESSLFTSMSGSAAIFEPRQLEPGNYKILAWWAGTQSNGQSILRSPRADYEISHAGEKDTILMNQSVDGGQWVELGTFRFDGLGNENVTLSIPSGSSSLPVSADAIAFVPVAGGGSLRDIIVDNLDPGFIALGDWDESGSTDEFMSSSLATFSPEDSAIWSPSLSTAGNYDVFYWNARSTRDGRKIARAPGVKYAISHAGSLTTVILNQNSAKSGTWNPMGTYFFDASGGENVVLLATSASYETGSAGADAFRFVLRNSGSAVDVIIDNLDPEFTVEGLWSESAAIDEFGGSSVYTLSTDGAAIWSLQNEAPGIYQVFIWNSGKLSGDRRIARNTNASYTIVHSGGSSVVAIDQNQQTGQWVPLGQFEFQGDGTEKISVKSGGNSTVADAVRLVKMQ